MRIWGAAPACPSLASRTQAPERARQRAGRAITRPRGPRHLGGQARGLDRSGPQGAAGGGTAGSVTVVVAVTVAVLVTVEVLLVVVVAVAVVVAVVV